MCGLRERQLAPIRKKIGILFQNAALFDSMTVAQNVAFPLSEGGVRDRNEISQRVHEALEVVELAQHKDKMPVNLSGGMRKRVGIARAIVARPQCVLYDEPTSGLDPIVSDVIDQMILRLQKRYAVTSIVVTHDMKSVFKIANRVAMLKRGVIHFLGTPQELRDSPDPEVQDFIEGRSEFSC
jgi:phospholipid/cholesterol/gamma-HCH transport system ATP-binding protein